MSTTTNPTPEPVTGEQPKPLTQLETPEIYYNKIWRVPPLVVTTQEQKDSLDPAEWTLDPIHVQIPGRKKPHFPKIYYDVNVPPRIVNSEEEAAALDSRYRDFAISEDVIKAAQATLDDAASSETQ